MYQTAGHNVRLGGWSGVCEYRLGPFGSQFHPIVIKFDPDWVKFWPHWIPLAPLGPEVEFGHFGVKFVKTWSSRRWYFIVKIRRWAPFGKNTKKSLPNHMCFSDESWFCDALACTGARRPWPTPQPAHRTKGSSDLASSEVTRIVAFWPFLELVTAATERRKWRQGLRLGAHLPHAPVARMTVLTQTSQINTFWAFVYPLLQVP